MCRRLLLQWINRSLCVPIFFLFAAVAKRIGTSSQIVPKCCFRKTCRRRQAYCCESCCTASNNLHLAMSHYKRRAVSGMPAAAAIILISVCWASSLGSRHNATRFCCWAQVPAADIDRYRYALLLSIDGTDRRTGRRDVARGSWGFWRPPPMPEVVNSG